MLETIRLMQEISWTTTVTEQSHAALATVHRVHKRYSLENLCKHAFLRQIRPLFTPTPDDSAKLQAQMQKLALRSPQKMDGHGLFVGRCITSLKEALPDEVRNGKTFGQQLFKEANALWNSLSPDAKAVWQSRARAEVNQMNDSFAEEVVAAGTSTMVGLQRSLKSRSRMGSSAACPKSSSQMKT